MTTDGPESPILHAPGSGLRVLVVDDCRDTTKSLALLLQIQGHCCCVAHTGLEALALAREFPPDVVLLDIGLPGMDGCAVAKHLQEESREWRPFLVAVTGYGQEEDRQRSREAGIDLHLVKPVDPDQLFRLLDRFHRVLHPPQVVLVSEGVGSPVGE